MIRFTVLGTPATAGSKNAFPFKKANGQLGVRVAHSNPQFQSWRHLVVCSAQEAYRGPVLTGPIQLTLKFMRPRPKGHYRTGKNAGVLKDDAPKFPTTKPDCTKLTRAIEDALKAVIWKDDSQVVSQVIDKVWGEQAGCVVEIQEIGAALAEAESPNV